MEPDWELLGRPGTDAGLNPQSSANRLSDSLAIALAWRRMLRLQPDIER